MIVQPIASRRFLGRREELELLATCRRSAASGRGCVVLIGGEAGIGKSRLLTEFARNKTSARVIWSECLEHAPRPFGPFRSLLASLVRATPELLKTSSAPGRLALRHFVPEASENGARSHEVAVEKAELFAGVVDLLEESAAKRALTIAIEDLHWSDGASLELLCYLAPRISGKRILLVASYRNDALLAEHPAALALARLARERTVHRISLEPLAQAELRELMESALEGRAPVSPSLLRQVERRSEGNPFFAEELLKNLVDQPASAGNQLPISIRSVMSERLAHLSSEALDIMRLASVLGQSFDPAILAVAAEADPGAILPLLERARDLQLIVEETGDRPRFRFRHALTRDAIASEMLRARSRPLHERIARTLEALPDADDRVAELAHHWWEVRNLPKALESSERAGDAAFALRAHAEALTYFERALELTEDDERRHASLLRKVGAAAFHAGIHERSLEAFEAARKASLRLNEYDDAAELTRSIAEQHYHRGHFGVALDDVELFLATHGSGLRAGRRAELTVSLALISLARFDAPRTLEYLSRVEVPLESLDPAIREAYWETRLTLSAYTGNRSEWSAAAAVVRQGLMSLSPVRRSVALIKIGQTAMMFADHREAERALLEGLALHEELASSSYLAFTRQLLALHHYYVGNLEQARDFCHAALASEGSALFVVRYQTLLSGPYIGLALDDQELVTRCLDLELLEGLRDQPNPNLHAVALASRAAVLVARDDISGARAALDEAIDALEISYSAIFLLTLAARYASMDRVAKARRLSAEAAAIPGNAVFVATSDLVEAYAAQRTGHFEDARKHARMAADHFQQLGWPLFEAQARELLGDAAAALAIYRRCGSTSSVRRIEPNSSTPRAPAGEPVLTERESEVALLVGRGLSNRAIADTLRVGVKTIEKHMSAIYAKLGVRSRTQLATYRLGVERGARE